VVNQVEAGGSRRPEKFKECAVFRGAAPPTPSLPNRVSVLPTPCTLARDASPRSENGFFDAAFVFGSLGADHWLGFPGWSPFDMRGFYVQVPVSWLGRHFAGICVCIRGG